MVHFASSDFLVIGLFFAAVLYVGFRSARAGADSTEFLLAGRSLTTPVFVMTLVSTWYGGILGVGEFSYRYGISNWFLQGLPYYIFAIIFAMALAKRIRATTFVTIPDKLQQAYGTPTAILGSVLTFILMTPAPYILMVAIMLQLVTGWSMVVCLSLGAGATVLYLFVGGFRSDVNTDILEFFLMFLGFAVILPFSVVKYGGFDFLASNLPPLHLTWNGGNSMQFVIVWFFIALWTLVDPSFHQRCYAAKTPEVAQRGILYSIIFWLIFDAMTATAGLYARAALPGLAQPVMAYPMLAEAVLPPVAKGLFYVGMLAAIMSSLNTLTFVSATTLGRDIVLRLRVVRRSTGEGPSIGDTVASLSAEGRDVVWTKIGLIMTGLLSIVLAVMIPSVIQLWYTIGTVIIPGLLVVLVTSYFPKLLVSPRWAFASMLLGWLVSLSWLLAGWINGPGATEAYPLGIEPMYPGLVVSFAFWLAGRKAVTRRREIQ
jgi:SSS family solute:Na+ symporter